MNAVITRVIVWLNSCANLVAAIVLRPIGALPGWVSATVVAIVTGVLMLIAFKYTSNQTAIKRVRGIIRANLLALSMFKDSVFVSLRCQRRIVVAAIRLLGLAFVPMLVMMVPMCLLLSQLALWYQARPLRAGEEATLTVKVSSQVVDRLDKILLDQSDSVEVVAGPVRVPAEQMICWNLRAQKAGETKLAIVDADKRYEKEWVAGDGFQRVSLMRPAWQWLDVLIHPHEAPFPDDSPIQSIEIVYPRRDGWVTGSDYWVAFLFIVSMVAAFAAKPLLGVHI